MTKDQKDQGPHFKKKISSKLDFLKTALVTIITNGGKMKMEKSQLSMNFAFALPYRFF